MDPSSLYRAQLAYRLNGNATADVAPNAPVLELPMTDSVIEGSALTVSGICDRNAQKVFVYIDGEKHEATLSLDGSCKYSIDITKKSGYHDLRVTQVINGVESAPNAARTVLFKHDGAVNPSVNVGESDGNLGIIVAVAAIGAVTLTAAGVGAFLAVKAKRKREEK